MSDLGNADRKKMIELLTDCDILCNNCGENSTSYCIEGIVNLLIANGATIPVRCENCIHCYQLIIDENGHWKEVKKGGTHNLCTRHDESFDVTCNGFCSYGERREGE